MSERVHFLRYSLCDDCLVGCHEHCGDPDIGRGHCDCGDAEHHDSDILNHITHLLSDFR